MKIAIFIAVVAIAGAFAETADTSGPPAFTCTDNALVCKFKEFGHHIKYHASKLGNNLKDVGSAVLASALDQGKDLLTSGAQAILGTVLEHLTKEGIVGKREISIFSKIREHVSNGMELAKKAKESLHAAFNKAVNRLTGAVKNIAGLKKIEDDADKEIDGAVEEFKKEGKKGFLAMVTAVTKKLQMIYQEGMKKLKEIYAKKMETRAILGFDSLSDAWEKAKSQLSGVASSIGDTFKPHLDLLQKGIADLAEKAKGHASNLVDAAKQSFNDLKGKLGDHVEQLKGHASKLGNHATNAVDALKQAISDIALQALENAKGTVGDIVNTGKDAADVVSNHVSDAVGGN